MRAVLIGATLVLASASARGQPSDADRATARALFEAGRQLMSENRHAEACPKLAESLRLVPGVGTRFNLGECYETIGKLASAWVNYMEVAIQTGKAGQEERAKLARERANALKPRLATMRIQVANPVAGLMVARNGRQVPEAQWNVALPVDHGVYRIEARAPGHETRTWEVAVEREGQAVSVAIELEREVEQPPPPPPPPPPKPAPEDGSALPLVGGIMTGVGGAALVLGVVFLPLGLDKIAEAEDNCPNRDCSQNPEWAEVGNDGRTLTDTGVGLMVVGGAVAATGVILLVVGLSDDEPQATRNVPLRAAPLVGPAGGGLSLQGTW